MLCGYKIDRIKSPYSYGTLLTFVWKNYVLSVKFFTKLGAHVKTQIVVSHHLIHPVLGESFIL